MKSISLQQSMPVSKTDIVLCLCAILLGGAIVFVNHNAPDETTRTRIQDYLADIVNRMDGVSLQIADWYVQDVSQ